MATISIVTPWLDNPQLIQTYEPSVRGAEVIIIDNGSEPVNASELNKMVDRLGGKYIRNQENMLFAPANNQGLEVASCEIVMFLNNDIEAPEGWLEDAKYDITSNVLAGPTLMIRSIGGKRIPYIEGWCIAAYKKVWDNIGGWNEKDYKGLYWEDNDLCFRAIQAGYELKRTDWDVWHFGNFTSSNTPGAYQYSSHNQAVFEAKVRETL